MSMHVRRAEPSDVDWILAELREFSAFYGTKTQLYGDESYAQSTMLGFIENHLVFVVETEKSEPIGFISGVITPHMFNPEIRVLSETFWWVKPQHRGSKAGLLLLNKFTEWGKANCDWITFALEEHSPVRDEILLKRGFRLQEKSFLMEVQ